MLKHAHAVTYLGLILAAYFAPPAAPLHYESFTGRENSDTRRTIRALEAQHGGRANVPAATDRLTRVGDKLARQIKDIHVSCHFYLLNEAAPNAYSLSCGCIYVTRGLYKELSTDDLLAAAIAHELAHVAAQDGKKPCTGSDCQLEKELRADGQAVRYLDRSGYAPDSLLSLVSLLRSEQPSGWADERLSDLKTAIEELRRPNDLRLADALQPN